MNKFFASRDKVLNLSFILIITFALNACGGGGGGGDTSLATGGFTKTIELTNSGESFGPFTIEGIREQGLYLASDIKGSGYIESVSFKRSGSGTAINCPDVTLRMGHTTLGALSTTYASNIEQGAGSLETVRTGALAIAAGSDGEYFTIALDQPFLYNGVDNLVVDFLVATACDTRLGLAHDRLAMNRTVWNDSLVSLTGLVYDFTLHTKFNIAGGDNSVLYPGTSANIIPFSTSTASRHVQMLHLASKVDGAGPITGVAMVTIENPTNAASYSVNIMLGHTTLSALTDTFADNFDSGSPVTVATALTFNVPAGVPVGTPIWLPITESFNYNGTDNLLVDVEVLTATTETLFNVASGFASHRLFAPVGDLTGIVNNVAYETVFRFNGGTMGIITGGTGGIGWPFSNAANPKQQFLYQSSELGTGGTITSIACRMNSATSIATDYPNFELVLGHTELTALTDTFADNMLDATTVFDGTYSLPGGLKRGDWIEIPLTTPFGYDPSKNLVVQHASDAGPVSHGCLNILDSSRFPSRRLWNADRTATTGNVADRLFDLKMEFTK